MCLDFRNPVLTSQQNVSYPGLSSICQMFWGKREVNAAVIHLSRDMCFNMYKCGTGIYQMRCTAFKVAPDDGLIQSETCRASNGK